MKNEIQQMTSDEITIKDIADFFVRNYRQIVLAGLAGILLATPYAFFSQKKYEAIWQMQMAQFIKVDDLKVDDYASNTINSEEPAALIQRLRFSSTYPPGVRQSCGMPQGGQFGDYLGGALEVKTIKGIPTLVAMKLRAPSVTQAKQCAEAIVSMIVAQQRDLIKERLAGRNEQLQQYQRALQEEQQQLQAIKKPELSNISYLASLDKLRWLRARIDVLKEELFLSQRYPAKLTVPIIVSSHHVAPKVNLLLFLGILFGLTFGILFALVREGWRKLV